MNEHNGNPVLAGVEAIQEPLAPVVGRRACRITRPMSAWPTYRGQWARAWQIDLDAMRKRLPIGAPADATLAHWIIEAPWSSQVIHSYSLIVAHLRFMLGAKAVTRYLEGATHEMALLAIHPSAERDKMLQMPTEVTNWLMPPVFAAHLIELNDEAAIKRVFRAIELIGEGRLSPHPTHFRSWVELFGDNMLRHARPAQPQQPVE